MITILLSLRSTCSAILS